LGAEKAIIVSPSGGYGAAVSLNNFHDEVCAKLELTEGKYALVGRVAVYNVDGDSQGATAKLVHDRNVVLDQVELVRLLSVESSCISLQALFEAAGNETITIEANTYDGFAYDASLVAIKVDQIERQ
jgi:hypothetical protein